MRWKITLAVAIVLFVGIVVFIALPNKSGEKAAVEQPVVPAETPRVISNTQVSLTKPEQNKQAVPVPAKLIEGKILAVSDKADLNLVVISVGKNDGVEPGMKFDVYRVGKYIGKIQAEKVEPQISSAFSIKEFQSDGIKVGDSITTSPY
ncbi:MAG: hypothetical protein V1701_00710 [Planctomycetota bacterium]